MVHIPSEPSSYDEAFKNIWAYVSAAAKVAAVREGRHKLADSMWRCKQKAAPLVQFLVTWWIMPFALTKKSAHLLKLTHDGWQLIAPPVTYFYNATRLYSFNAKYSDQNSYQGAHSKYEPARAGNLFPRMAPADGGNTHARAFYRAGMDLRT